MLEWQREGCRGKAQRGGYLLAVSSFRKGTAKMSSSNWPNLERRIRTWTTVVLFASIVAGLISNAHARDCGGVERWTVKVATDDSAASVDPSDVADTTVVNLNNERRPSNASRAGDTRLSQEMSLVQVSGFIRFIKLERDDNDFHLVITDSADAQFTTAGTGSRPTGTSLIAEAPNPACVSGRNGDGPTKSLFRQIWRMSETASRAIWRDRSARRYLSPSSLPESSFSTSHTAKSVGPKT